MWQFQIYADRAGGFRWRLVAPNGKTIADSGEGYDSRYNAKRAAENVRQRIGGAIVVDL